MSLDKCSLAPCYNIWSKIPQKEPSLVASNYQSMTRIVIELVISIRKTMNSSHNFALNV